MRPKVKKVIVFHNRRIPVYCADDRQAAIRQLLDVLERKKISGRKLVRNFLSDLDRIEIEGSEAMLFSKRDGGPLALSLY